MTPLSAAIRTRPAPMASAIVWVHRPERGTWCVLRRATGGRIVTLCCDWLDGSARVNILTSAAGVPDHMRPRNSCSACETELAAGTPGAAVAVEPTVRAAEELFGALPVASRTVTPRERPQPTMDPVAAWDSWYEESNRGAPADDAPGPDSAAIRAVLEHEDLLGDGEAM